LTDFDAELPLLRSPSPFLSRSAGEEGGWGEGEGRQAYFAAPALPPSPACSSGRGDVSAARRRFPEPFWRYR